MNAKAAIFLGLVLLFSSNLILSVSASASDNEGSLNSGYAVTNNYHGIDVPMGAQVVVTAMSTNSHVDNVRFIWKNPAGQVIWAETVNVYTDGSKFTDNNGNQKLIYYAKSTHEPETLGDWGVQAQFYNEVNVLCFEFDIRLATRATSFNVIPEVPILGTAGISIAMVLGLAFFKRKGKSLEK